MPKLKAPYDYRLNKPHMVEILSKKQEYEGIITLTFGYDPIDEPLEIHPGQFVMVWVPGNDEVPMSISHIYKDNKISISVKDVGDTTHKLCNLEKGDKIGIRGPYGNWFELKKGKEEIAIIIGGGVGTAAVLPLVYRAFKELEKGNLKNVLFMEGGKNSNELIYLDEISKFCTKLGIEDSDLFYCTDDGSLGFKGFPTEKLEILIEEELNEIIPQGKSTVYACGPEIMLKSLFEICEKHKIDVQFSLERMMRCGFGICGLCALEPTGLLVCKDGPVFSNDVLRRCTDFGKMHRDFSGREHPI